MYCGSTDLKEVKISRRGKVVTYAIPHVMAKGDVAPVTFAVVETEDGARLAGYCTDCDPFEIKIGMPVKVVIRRVGLPGLLQEGIVSHGPKFKPIRRGVEK